MVSRDAGKPPGEMSREDLLDKTSDWSLGCDNALLERLKSFSENLVQSSEGIVQSCDTLEKDVDVLQYQVLNVTNEFLMIGNTQFVENRVQEFEEFSVGKSKPKNDKPELTKAEMEADLIAKMKEAIQIGVRVSKERDTVGANAMEESITGSTDTRFTSSVNLAHLIGTPKFFSSKYCGLLDENRLIGTRPSSSTSGSSSADVPRRASQAKFVSSAAEQDDQIVAGMGSNATRLDATVPESPGLVYPSPTSQMTSVPDCANVLPSNPTSLPNIVKNNNMPSSHPIPSVPPLPLPSRRRPPSSESSDSSLEDKFVPPTLEDFSNSNLQQHHFAPRRPETPPDIVPRPVMDLSDSDEDDFFKPAPTKSYFDSFFGNQGQPELPQFHSDVPPVMATGHAIESTESIGGPPAQPSVHNFMTEQEKSLQPGALKLTAEKLKEQRSALANKNVESANHTSNNPVPVSSIAAVSANHQIPTIETKQEQKKAVLSRSTISETPGSPSAQPIQPPQANQIPKAKVSSSSTKQPPFHSAVTKPSKVTSKKVSIFDSSDSEDDLFSSFSRKNSKKNSLFSSLPSAKVDSETFKSSINDKQGDPTVSLSDEEDDIFKSITRTAGTKFFDTLPRGSKREPTHAVVGCSDSIFSTPSDPKDYTDSEKEQMHGKHESNKIEKESEGVDSETFSLQREDSNSQYSSLLNPSNTPVNNLYAGTQPPACIEKTSVEEDISARFEPQTPSNMSTAPSQKLLDIKQPGSPKNFCENSVVSTRSVQSTSDQSAHTIVKTAELPNLIAVAPKTIERENIFEGSSNSPLQKPMQQVEERRVAEDMSERNSAVAKSVSLAPKQLENEDIFGTTSALPAQPKSVLAVPEHSNTDSIFTPSSSRHNPGQPVRSALIQSDNDDLFTTSSPISAPIKAVPPQIVPYQSIFEPPPLPSPPALKFKPQHQGNAKSIFDSSDSDDDLFSPKPKTKSTPTLREISPQPNSAEAKMKPSTHAFFPTLDKSEIRPPPILDMSDSSDDDLFASLSRPKAKPPVSKLTSETVVTQPAPNAIADQPNQTSASSSPPQRNISPPQQPRVQQIIPAIEVPEPPAIEVPVNASVKKESPLLFKSSGKTKSLFSSSDSDDDLFSSGKSKPRSTASVKSIASSGASRTPPQASGTVKSSALKKPSLFSDSDDDGDDLFAPSNIGGITKIKAAKKPVQELRNDDPKKRTTYLSNEAQKLLTAKTSVVVKEKEPRIFSTASEGEAIPAIQENEVFSSPAKAKTSSNTEENKLFLEKPTKLNDTSAADTIQNEAAGSPQGEMSEPADSKSLPSESVATGGKKSTGSITRKDKKFNAVAKSLESIFSAKNSFGGVQISGGSALLSAKEAESVSFDDQVSTQNLLHCITRDRPKISYRRRPPSLRKGISKSANTLVPNSEEMDPVV